MASPAPSNRSPYFIPIVLAAIAAAILAGVLVYLNQTPKTTSREAPPTPEAKAYVRYLKLSGVTLKAAENLMNQQVVEVDGKITNTGPRALRSVDVYCLFYGVNGRQIHRERVPMLPSGAAPLKPNETRSFRLPFDDLPQGWNQTVPGMVIAGIAFAQ
jgi:hypothetical protein